MIKQLLNSVVAKYRDLSVSRISIISLSLRLQQIIDLLASDKSRYFVQPRPIIVNYYSTSIHCTNPDFLIGWFVPRDTGLWENDHVGVITELRQRHRRRRGRRLVKNESMFYQRNSRLFRSVWFANGSKIVPKLNMQWRRSIPNGNTKNKPSSSTLRRWRRTWSFQVVVLQRNAKKCSKIQNARA